MDSSRAYAQPRFVAAAAGACLLVGAVVMLSMAAVRQVRDADDRVSHTRDVLEAAQRLELAYVDVPLHSERYAVTGDRAEVARVAAGERTAAEELSELRRLTKDNPSQQRRLDALDLVYRDGVEYNRRLRGLKGARFAEALESRPEKPQERLRALREALVAEEQRLLVERRAQLESSFRRTRGALALACLAALLCLGAVLLLLARDLRREREAAEKLRLRGEELARSNNELERFAYVASHDLKEPLRMVVSYTQLLQRRYQAQLGGDAAEFIGYAVDGATRMASLIDGLLEFSRAGRPVELTEVGVAACLDDALRNLGGALRESGGRVERGELPVVRANALELTRVLQNLVANALKFRGERAPVVRVDAARRGDMWELSVADNGIGLTEGDADKVFGLFQRLNTRTRYPGTGIGLAVCKKIVESRGGRIWVEGRPGEGATFRFTVKAA